jgi:membrane-bound lytic murein transglycosylase B
MFIQNIIQNDYLTNFKTNMFIAKFKVKLLVFENKVAILKSAKMLAIASIFAIVPISVKSADASYTPNIVFDKTNANAVYVNKNIHIAAIGESINNKTIREQQEAAAIASAKSAVKSTSQNTVTYHSDPSDFDQIYKVAGAQFGVPWQILKAVHYVETGCSGSTTKGSYAGAKGPMQFMAGTWSAYGVDGNGDGVADIYDVTDAIFGAANLLAQGGAAEGNVTAALFNYNHSQSYVNKVLEVASSVR